MEKFFVLLLVSFFAIDQCLCEEAPEQHLAPLSLRVGNKEFLILSNEYKNWFGALHYCRRIGMDLATVENNEEHYSLISFFKDNSVYKEYWIGGNDLEYNDLNKFYWANSGEKMSYTNWTPGNPDNYKSQENCVHMIWSKYDGWNDNNCGQQKSFVCSKTL